MNPTSWISLQHKGDYKLHGIKSIKTMEEEDAKRKVVEEDEYLVQSQLYKKNFDRFCRLMWVLFIVTMNLPFNTVTQPIVRKIFRLCTYDEMDASFSVGAFYHLLTEIYSHVKSKIIYGIEDTMKLSPIYGLGLNIDIWKVKTSGKSYIGLRVYYIDGYFQYESRLLSIREFNPSLKIRQNGKLSSIIYNWIKSIFSDFSIKKESFFGATTDGGSDIKCVIQKHMKINWEYCPPHSFSRAVKAAIGRKGEITEVIVDTVKESVKKIKQVIYS